MTTRLFVRHIEVGKHQFRRLEWSLYSFVGERIGSGVDEALQLSELIAQYNLGDVSLHYIIPASEFSFQTAEVPARQARYVQQALPFVIEESVAEDIEDMHLVVGKKLSSQQYPVLLAKIDTMDFWYKAALELGIPLHGMYLDADLIRSENAATAVLIDGEDALVYAEGLSCTRTSLANLAVYLELVSNETDDNLSIHILVAEGERERHNVLLAQLAQIEQANLEIDTFTCSVFDVVCAAYFNDGDLTNLCHSRFPGTAQDSQSTLRKWLPLAAVATLLFLVQIGFDLAETFLHQRQADQYREQSVKLYQSLFPQERTIASPRRQLEGKLRNAANRVVNTDFLAMLGEIGYQLSQQPQKSRMTLNNMQYSEKRGELAMEISAPSLDDLDRYKQSITQSGYQVNIGSAIKEASSVRGKLTVQGG